MSRRRFVFKYEDCVCDMCNNNAVVALYASECVWRWNQIASFFFQFVLSHSLCLILVRLRAAFPVSLILLLLLPISYSIRFRLFARYALA